MAEKTYKLTGLPRHLGKRLGRVVKLTDAKKLLKEIGWEDLSISATIDEETFEKLVVAAGGEDSAPKAKGVVTIKEKVESVAQADKPRSLRRGALRMSIEVGDVSVATPRRAPAGRVAPKIIFDDEDLREARKRKPVETVKVEELPAAGKEPAVVSTEEAALSELKTAMEAQLVTPPAVEKASVSAQPSETKAKKTAKKRKAQLKTQPERRLPQRKKIKEIGRQPDEAVEHRSRKRIFKIKGSSPRSQTVQEFTPLLRITGDMSVRVLSEKSGIKAPDIIGFLLSDLEILANINGVVSEDEIQLVAEHFGIEYEVKPEEAPEDILVEYEDISEENLVPRPPVVTVMGHVDHGKTLLLDRIRHTNVVASESGGITQHIGAYQIEIKGKPITFVDTPGHAAFTQMRARGSQVTDIVILVVACDDGVKPQTKEAIEHARAANVPIIVALNKVDLPSATAERTMTQLSEIGLVSEEYEGDTTMVKISALTGENIDELLEMVILQSDLMELKADPTAPAYGIVVESEVTIGQGVVATVLVVQGTLRQGQYLVTGTSAGRIKRMEDEWGVGLSEALPSRPVRIIGLDELPKNGDKIFAFSQKRRASEIIETRRSRERLSIQKTKMPMTTLEDFFTKLEKGEIKDLNLVIKCDVGGSEEAIVGELERIDVEGASIHIISSGVGQINENDLMLASASDAIIVGFNVSLTSGAKAIVETEKVDVRIYDIIYKMSEDIRKAMLGLLDPLYEEIPVGRVEVRQIFKTDKESVICGGYVLEGKAERNRPYRLMRDDEIIMEGTLNSLRRFKDDVKEVGVSYECGFVINGTNDVEPGDILKLYELKEVERV